MTDPSIGEGLFARYFDDRGYLECVERWGGDDGPDDASENFTDWTVLHAIGAADSILLAYKKGWEGHLRQFTEARTTDDRPRRMIPAADSRSSAGGAGVAAGTAVLGGKPQA